MASFDTDVRLDDLYKMVAYIYSDKNLSRPASATFSHFVEVCGMLTIHDRKKGREGIDVTEALCKALGWYFPLLAKMRISSVEELIFRKFPAVCPYCRQVPHNESDCKLIRGTETTVNHGEVARYFEKNWETRPKDLDSWQNMFQRIYPRRVEEHGRSTIGLLEELGELAESIRVFEAHPKYFLGEAADTFSYLMGIANEHELRIKQDGGVFSFQTEFLKRYPGICMQCGSPLCVCPAIPEATVGRMAKELEIGRTERPFIQSIEIFSDDGRKVGRSVLEKVGGHAQLSNRLPFDRGDVNRALVALCLRIADAVEKTNKMLADKLRAEALRISTNARLPGSHKQPMNLDVLLGDIESAWRTLDRELRLDIRNTNGLIGEFGVILDKIRILFVYCSPKDEKGLRVSAELRAIQQCADSAAARVQISVDALPAATVHDFRRKLLQESYDIVHFAGHANADYLVFEDENGKSTLAPLSAVTEAMERDPLLKGVILNACETGIKLTAGMSPSTIAMMDSIDDEAAIEFARGFYDAIVAGKAFKDAYKEGLTAVKFANFKASDIVLF